MIKLCMECYKEVECDIVKRTVTSVIKSISVETEEEILICKECGEIVWDTAMEDENQKRAFEKYKDIAGLLTGEKIKAIRKKYNLTAEEFSLLLGCGKKTITRYENGAIQDLTHDNLIRTFEDSKVLKKIWMLRKDSLSAQTCKKLESYFEESEDIVVTVSCDFNYKTRNGNYKFTNKNNGYISTSTLTA